MDGRRFRHVSASETNDHVSATFLLSHFRSFLFPLRFRWKIIQIQHNRIKNPAGRRQPVGYLSVAENLNSGRPSTNLASGQSGTRTRDRRIASPTRLYRCRLCPVLWTCPLTWYASQSGHAIYRGSRGIGLEKNLRCGLVFEQNLQF